MFDINKVVTDHVNSIESRGVRDWLTKLNELDAFQFSIDGLAYYVVEEDACGLLAVSELRHILGVLEAIEAGFYKDFPAPREPVIKTRSNGGVICDNMNGPCSCGAWHKVGDADA